MRGDDFRRGSFGESDNTEEETTRPELIPATGRDNVQMFWESIGLKPGDDWRNEASSNGQGSKKRGGQDGGGD